MTDPITIDPGSLCSMGLHVNHGGPATSGQGADNNSYFQGFAQERTDLHYDPETDTTPSIKALCLDWDSEISDVFVERRSTPCHPDCKPCSFYVTKRGCKYGVDCAACHAGIHLLQRKKQQQHRRSKKRYAKAKEDRLQKKLQQMQEIVDSTRGTVTMSAAVAWLNGLPADLNLFVTPEVSAEQFLNAWRADLSVTPEDSPGASEDKVFVCKEAAGGTFLQVPV
eukprot:TRINITY_DN11526_c1_g1_i1.p1 TRINITY_DN11526_c1_g1~~TRINITY_DN11526_c1_g1_i1.p1  ORF type:complete len:244 (+),score=49.86 TRINITY_DN11526_c1_g1_i1:61-732(+)